MDDNKISHFDENRVSRVIEEIEAKFGKMSVTRGNEHVFWVMNIIFNKNSIIAIMLKDYLEESIDDFGEDIVSATTSQAQKGVFAVDEHSENLGNSKSGRLYSITANLLYVSNRVRLDIRLAIDFICTIVSKVQYMIGGS